MAKSKTSQWSTTRDSNSEIDGIDISENCPAAGINNAIRELMSQIAAARTGNDDGIVTGTPAAAQRLAKWDANGDLVDAGVTLSGLDSKVITGTPGTENKIPIFNADGDIVGSGKEFSGGDTYAISGTPGTNGNLAKWDANGDLIDGPGYGTSGANNLLQLNGSGALPAIDGSNLTGLATGTKFLESFDASSSSTISLTAFDSGAYDAYLIMIANAIPATDNVILQMLTSTDGGSTYDSGASDYYSHVSGTTVGGSAFSSVQNPGAAINLASAIGNDTGEDGVSANIFIHAPHLAKRTSITWNAIWWQNTGNLVASDKGFAVRDSAADVDAVQFAFSSGAIASGTFTIWGLKNA